MHNEKKVNLDVLIKLSKANGFDINKALVIRKYIPYREKIECINKFVNESLVFAKRKSVFEISSISPARNTETEKPVIAI